MTNMYYQDTGQHIVDYHLFQLEGSREFLRGPRMTLEEGQYIAFVGAAQTFGTLCRHPFPDLVAERVGLASLNLGIGGAGPEKFLQDPALMKAINGSRLAVVQVLSGRSVPNRLIETIGGTNTVRRRDHPDQQGRWSDPVWAELLDELPRDELLELVKETQRNWVALMSTLLKAIAPPKILLWMSKRGFDYTIGFDAHWALMGEFPHFVTRGMLEPLVAMSEAFVDVTSARGLPQLLYDKYRGQRTIIKSSPPADRNDYYPSPEMHVDVVEKLAPVIATHIYGCSTGGDKDPAARHSGEPAYKAVEQQKSRVAVLLSHERSGSHLLKHLLNSSGRISSTGEVCNLGNTPETDPTSFFGVRQRLAKLRPELLIPYPENARTVAAEFFEHLRNHSSSEVLLVDLKYTHAQHFNSFGHWTLGWCNVFIDYLRSESIRVVHLYRKNIFAAVASNLLANAVRQWHSHSGPIRDAKVEIDRDIFVLQALTLASSILTWRRRLQQTDSFSISYEELQADVASDHSKVLEIGRFLGVDTNWLPSAPDKKMSPAIEDYVSNFDDVRDLWEMYSDIDRLETLLMRRRGLLGSHNGLTSELNVGREAGGRSQ